ncbi:hypothetical protein K2173_010105 [Erythroxylum novogranatense]|uniref:Uncharacterized protein n=1 Tax=Erythroxylum novogranatense TaxID=1862640 RepID=A0AAV8SCI9_9ROSI|nr:hypothetical protein K2173_010105 [Erythroxylum novogranatense]
MGMNRRVPSDRHARNLSSFSIAHKQPPPKRMPIARKVVDIVVVRLLFVQELEHFINIYKKRKVVSCARRNGLELEAVNRGEEDT